MNIVAICLVVVLMSPLAVNAVQPGDTMVAMVGGKTESQSVQTKDAKRFSAISQHMAMVVLEEVTATNKKVVESASAVILNDRFIVTSAHIFEGFKFDSTHIGFVFFGSSGRWQDRTRVQISKSEILNHDADDLAARGWSSRPGNKDYVFILIKDGVPSGFKKIAMMNDITFFKTGDLYHAAGFGVSENEQDDKLLRILDETLSRSSTDQTSTSFPTLPDFLGVEDRVNFLEFNGSSSATVNRGDSGGAFYYEGTDGDGGPKAFLAGIISGHWAFGPVVANYGLRIDAFLSDAVETAKHLPR